LALGLAPASKKADGRNPSAFFVDYPWIAKSVKDLTPNPSPGRRGEPEISAAS